MTYRGIQNLIKRGDEAGVKAALQAGLGANLANQNGWTLLMLAAVEGSVPIGSLLLEHGAEPSNKNSTGETAQDIADKKGHTEFVQLLRGQTGSAS